MAPGQWPPLAQLPRPTPGVVLRQNGLDCTAALRTRGRLVRFRVVRTSSLVSPGQKRYGRARKTATPRRHLIADGNPGLAEWLKKMLSADERFHCLLELRPGNR